jgi:hypothetical protein
MNDSSCSITKAIAAKGDVPTEVGLRLGVLAGVPAEQRQSFCDLLNWVVGLVWQRDRRAYGGKPGAALTRAAEAARTLHEALDNLEPDDRAWLEKLWLRTPEYTERLPDVPETAFQLAHLLSVAVGKAPPPTRGQTSRPRGGRRKGSVKDVFFLDFVRLLFVIANDTGGDLAIENECGTGTMIQALKILRPYLPKGVVPIVPPAGTLQRLKANPFDYYTPPYGTYSFDPPKPV